MPVPLYITGPAGSGKTYTLLNKTAEFAKKFIVEDHQSLLALSYMHGARQLLDASLASHKACSRVRRSVQTIDGFALQLVSQWRSSLGITGAVYASSRVSRTGLECPFGTQFLYDQIVSTAANLLQHPTVRVSIASSHPLVIVDEFQDCTGYRLRIVCELSSFLPVILAADSFQHLDMSIAESPATAWIEKLSGVESSMLRLTGSKRTNQAPIINASSALRFSKRAAEPSIPVFVVPRGRGNTLGLAASKILYSSIGNRQNGSFAAIFPSNLQDAEKIISSMRSQAEKKKLAVSQCHLQLSSDQESEKIHAAVSKFVQPGPSHGDRSVLTAEAVEALERAELFCRLRGYSKMDEELLQHFVGRVLHAKRAYGRTPGKIVFTTVHGAKNREFDHVFVVWGYRLQQSLEQQRRLLYNAVTRARTSCVILDTRALDIVIKDPLMQMLGNPLPHR